METNQVSEMSEKGDFQFVSFQHIQDIKALTAGIDPGHLLFLPENMVIST